MRQSSSSLLAGCLLILLSVCVPVTQAQTSSSSSTSGSTTTASLVTETPSTTASDLLQLTNNVTTTDADQGAENVTTTTEAEQSSPSTTTEAEQSSPSTTTEAEQSSPSTTTEAEQSSPSTTTEAEQSSPSSTTESESSSPSTTEKDFTGSSTGSTEVTEMSTGSTDAADGLTASSSTESSFTGSSTSDSSFTGSTDGYTGSTDSYTGSTDGYTGSTDGYTGSSEGFYTGSTDDYYTGSSEGYYTGSSEGYFTGSTDDYYTGSSEGYYTGSTDDYYTASTDDYYTGSSEGYYTGSTDDYYTGSSEGYYTGSTDDYYTGSTDDYYTGSTDDGSSSYASSTEYTDFTDGSTFESSIFGSSTESTDSTDDFGLGSTDLTTESNDDTGLDTTAGDDLTTESIADIDDGKVNQADKTTAEKEVTTEESFTTESAAEEEVVEWWITTPAPEYAWTEPKAWSSDRLYAWGEDQGDIDMLASSDILEKYFTCLNIKLNGQVGAPFFNSRYYTIYVCNNGVLTMNQLWRESYPKVFETTSWFDDKPVIAPYWAQSDEATMSLLAGEFPDAKSQVYYHVYERSGSMDDATSEILAKAQADVENSDQAVDGFVPSWVLVATWVNLAYVQEGCRETVILDDIGISDTVALLACEELAKTTALNHFQAVFMTDGVYTFVKYNYPEDGINWAYPGITTTNQEKLNLILENSSPLTGLAVAGLTSGDKLTGVNTTNIYITNSNSPNLVQVDDLEGNLKDKKKGEWLFRVESSTGSTTPEAECDQWISLQNAVSYFEYSVDNPCPTSLWQAQLDNEYSLFTETIIRACYTKVFAQGDMTQQCCYNNDWLSNDFSALLVGAPHGGYVSDVNTTSQDYGFQKCCIESGMCKHFYKVRPSDNGQNYAGPSIRAWFGDPHITTSDGLGYTFNGLGEYLFTQIENGATIQARTERVKLGDGTYGLATFFSAVCIEGTGSPKVQIQVNKEATNTTTGVENLMQLIVDGNEKDINLIAENANTSQTLDGVDNVVFKRSNTSVTVLLSSGVSVTAGISNGMLSITPGFPSSLKGKTIGLTGVYDDDITNDFSYDNGTVAIASNSSESDIFSWASTFAVSESDSIMYYTESNTDWSTYNSNSFTPVFTDDVDNWDWGNGTLKDSAYSQCGDDMACLYDVFITGDLAIGASTLTIKTENEESNAIIANTPPIINGSDSLFITIGEEFQYTIKVNDSADDTFTVTTNINAVVSVSADDVTITATVTNTSGFSLTISAKDSSGAVSTHTPLVMMCSCANNGTCVELNAADQEDVSTDSVLLDCICPTGYTGSLCETDLDACALVASPCYPGVLCVDSPPPADHTGYSCGDCPAGYSGDGKTCSDIDECAIDSCDHICINSPGSFTCTCRPGYELNADGLTCDDIDECLTISPCHQVCNNTAGSYVCSCEENFDLASDNANCEPASPCEQPSPCDDVNGYCNFVNEISECSCKRGYTLNAQNSSICEEIDECLLGIDACAQNCSNTVGAYTCSCGAGYTLDSDGFGCTDNNECLLGTYVCHATQVCSNNAGGYECVCPTGQTLEAGACVDIQFDSPVENITETPSVQATQNAVIFTLQGMTIDEYTVEKEITLFTVLASTLTTQCADGTCDYEATSANRRKRAAAVTYYKEYFSRAPGYPQIDADGNLVLSVYSDVPGSGVLQSADLLAAVQSASTDIETQLGVTFVGAEVAYIPTTTTATTVVEATTPATANNTNVGLIIGMVILAIVVVLIVVGVVVFLKIRAKQNAKTSPDPESSERPPSVRPPSGRPTTARTVAEASRPASQPANQPQTAAEPAAEPAQPERRSTPELIAQSSKVVLPPLVMPTDSASQPTTAVHVTGDTIPPVETNPAYPANSRPGTATSRPGTATSRPGSGGKQTQAHSRTGTPVGSTRQTPLDA